MNRPLLGALIGYGFIAENGHMPGYRACSRASGGIRIVAVADICPARRQRAEQQIPGARIYSDAEALLSDRSLELDFVDIAVPPCDHESVALAALARGLHVLCEKPLATTPEAARAMLEKARRVRRVLFPCHSYKHAPVIRTVNSVLASGRIGRVQMVTLDTLRHTHARGVAEWRPDWRREHRYAGGGIGMDHGSHTFYLALDWMNSEPLALTAKMHTPAHADTEENLCCSLEFPTGIARAHLSWTAGIRKVLYGIHGERGTIRVEDDEIEIAFPIPGSGRPRWEIERVTVPSEWMDAGHGQWFGSLIDEFVKAIQEQDYAGAEAQQALACVELISAAYASAANACRELPLGPANVGLEALTG